MIISFVLGTLFCLLSGFWLIAANVLPLWSHWVLALVLWTLWLASGCLAATAAELLRRRVLPHALLGLCLPYIYPVLLVWLHRRNAAAAEESSQQEEIRQQETNKQELAGRFQAMQARRDQERRERIAEHHGISVEEVAAREEALRAPREEQAEQAAAAVEEPAAEMADAPVTDNEIYQILYAQPVDAEGVRQGPFQFTLVSGGTIDIAGVRDLQQEFMICTVYGTGKSVRMKYTQVGSIARYETE